VGGSTWVREKAQKHHDCGHSSARKYRHPARTGDASRRHYGIAVHIEGVTHLFVRCQSAAAFIAPFDMAFHAAASSGRKLAVEPAINFA